MSLIRKHRAVLQAWVCLALVCYCWRFGNRYRRLRKDHLYLPIDVATANNCYIYEKVDSCFFNLWLHWKTVAIFFSRSDSWKSGIQLWIMTAIRVMLSNVYFWCIFIIAFSVYCVFSFVHSYVYLFIYYCLSTLGYTKPWAIKTCHLSISSPIIDRFSKFFHRHTL